jgi:hypothetical protein
MGEHSATIPILPGKKAKLEELARAISGPKQKDFAESEKRCRIDKETGFLQSTPQGDALIIYVEARDTAKASEDWRSSKHPFDLWVKERAKEITGVDFNNPPASEGPKQIIRYGF